MLGKETLPMTSGKKRLSSTTLKSITQEYLPVLAIKWLSNLHKNADLWDVDTMKAWKATVDINKTFTL